MAFSHCADVSERIKNLAFKKFEFETALQDATDSVTTLEDVQKVLKLTEQVRTIANKSDSDLRQRFICTPTSGQADLSQSAGPSNQPGTVRVTTDSRGVVTVASQGNVQTVVQQSQGGSPKKAQKQPTNSKSNKPKPPKIRKNPNMFVYMPDIPQGVGKSDVASTLACFGTVKNVHFFPARAGKQHNGFVEFDSVGPATQVANVSYGINGALVDFEPVNGRLVF